MDKLLYAVGTSFLRAFVGSLIVLAAGVLAAPNLNHAYAVGVAALFASVAAGMRAIQRYVPALTVGNYIGQPYGAWTDSFLRAFVGTLVITLPGVLEAPDLDTARALGVAAVVGAFTAALRATQGLLSRNELPVRAVGLADPPEPVTGI